MNRLATERAAASPPALAIADRGSMTMQSGRCSAISALSLTRWSSAAIDSVRPEYMRNMPLLT